MRKSFIRHENMKRVMNEILSLGEDVPDDTFDKLLNELKHSCLIVAGNVNGDEINVMTAKTDNGDFGMLFTDMDEFGKVFPDFEVEAHHNPFETYLSMLKRSDLEGYILNFKGEGMILPRFISNLIEDVPDYSFSTENSYTSTESKQLKDSKEHSYVGLRNEDYRDESYYDYEDECWCDEYVPEYDPFDSLDDDYYQF